MESTLYLIARHSHSILRWFLLATLVATVFIAGYHVIRRKGLAPYGRMISRITVYLSHLQLLVGALLYLISPRVIFSGESMQSPILRFYLIEHLLVMLMAITLITLGYIRMKRARDMAASRNIFWFYLFSLLLFLSGIPWPFMPYGGEWL